MKTAGIGESSMKAMTAKHYLLRLGIKRDGAKRIRFCRKCKNEFDK